MKPVVVEKASIKIVGIEIRTNNQEEMGPNGKIGPQWKRFYQEDLSSKIQNQVSQEKTFAIYSDYESDFRGEYSFILGKEVRTFGAVFAGMIAKILPVAKYVIFTSEKGLISNIVMAVWKYIWVLKPTELGGNWVYNADFEVYDSRSSDLKNAQIDVFLSIK